MHYVRKMYQDFISICTVRKKKSCFLERKQDDSRGRGVRTTTTTRRGAFAMVIFRACRCRQWAIEIAWCTYERQTRREYWTIVLNVRRSDVSSVTRRMYMRPSRERESLSQRFLTIAVPRERRGSRHSRITYEKKANGLADKRGEQTGPRPWESLLLAAERAQDFVNKINCDKSLACANVVIYDLYMVYMMIRVLLPSAIIRKCWVEVPREIFIRKKYSFEKHLCTNARSYLIFRVWIVLVDVNENRIKLLNALYFAILFQDWQNSRYFG